MLDRVVSMEKRMPRLIRNFLRRRLENLRFPQLLVLTAVVWIVTLVVPDPLPFLDEILLGLGTLLLASWKRRRSEAPSDRDKAAQVERR
jgi:hypothetical protein